MSEPNLIAIGWLAGLRSRGITPIMRGNRVAWLPFPSPLTESEMAILKAHRQAIKDAIRAAPSVNDDYGDAPAAAPPGEIDARASNASGVNPFVSSDAASSPTTSEPRRLGATVKLDPAVAADEKLRLTDPARWRLLHPDHPEVIAEADAAATAVMYTTVGVPSRWL